MKLTFQIKEFYFLRERTIKLKNFDTEKVQIS